MTDRLRIGTRGSPLARAQTDLVVRALRRADPNLRLDVVPLRTSGDRTRRTGPTLDFTDEIDRRLERGEIDLAVHSAKDLPARPSRGVELAAFLRREDPRDCLILRAGRTLRTLPRGARLGSSSLRRRAQLLSVRPDLDIVPIRGNIGTRIDQIGRAGLDGVILASAGLRRLGWSGQISGYLSTARWLPAPGQGAIAVEVREGDEPARRAVAKIDHFPTRAAVTAERAVVRTLGGDCDLPLGAIARLHKGRLRLRAALFSPDGRVRVSAQASGAPARCEAIGEKVGRALLAFGMGENRGRRAHRSGP